jgi:hypothetical protein
MSRASTRVVRVVADKDITKIGTGMGFPWAGISLPILIPIPILKLWENPWVYPYPCYTLVAAVLGLEKMVVIPLHSLHLGLKRGEVVVLCSGLKRGRGNTCLLWVYNLHISFSFFPPPPPPSPSPSLPHSLPSCTLN